MLMLMLVAALIVMMGFAVARHWKVRDKYTLSSPHRSVRRRS